MQESAEVGGNFIKSCKKSSIMLQESKKTFNLVAFLIQGIIALSSFKSVLFGRNDNR